MNRRKFITATSTAVVAAVAGCLGGDSDSDGDTSDGDNAESTENKTEDDTETGTESGSGSDSTSGSDSDTESGVEEELFGAAADVEPGEEGQLEVIEGDIDNVLTGIEIVDHVCVVASYPERDDSYTVSVRVRNTGSEVFNLFDYGGANLILVDSDGNQLSEDRTGVSNQSGDGTPSGETFVVDLYAGEPEGDVSRYEIEFNCENTSGDLAYCPEN